jgi:hypothetical protein
LEIQVLHIKPFLFKKKAAWLNLAHNRFFQDPFKTNINWNWLNYFQVWSVYKVSGFVESNYIEPVPKLIDNTLKRATFGCLGFGTGLNRWFLRFFRLLALQNRRI